jgi:hypothetical protein
MRERTDAHRSRSKCMPFKIKRISTLFCHTLLKDYSTMPTVSNDTVSNGRMIMKKGIGMYGERSCRDVFVLTSGNSSEETE